MDADDTDSQLDEMAEALDGTIRALVRAHPGIELDDLSERATEALLGDDERGPTAPVSPVAADSPESDTDADHDADEDPDTDAEPLAHVEVVDLVTDLVYAHTFELCDQHGPLIETADGKLLDLSEMVTDKVFTHRVDTAEAQRRGLDIGFDLWALSGSTVTGGEEPDSITVTQDYFLQHWDSPAWEGLLADGSLVAISVDGAGVASIRVLDQEPPLDPEILESFRSAYELHCEATDTPPSSDLLVAEMLLDEPSTFDTPTAPLSEYATNLGLEVRRSVVADDPAQWRILGTEHRLERLTDWFDPSTNLAAMEVVDIAERIALGEPLEDHSPDEDRASDVNHRPAEDTAEMHRVVESLSRRQVREGVSDEFFGDHEGFLPPVDPEPFLELAVEVAERGEPRAAVHLMRQRMWQHRGDLDAAEGELRMALVEDPQFTDAADRLAWFASLRGDAVTALRLWQGIPPHPETARNIATIEPFAHPRAKPGRNEPCWCGSGIKFKKCHRDMAPVAPLAERVPWLWRKAFGFVATTGITGRKHVVEVAVARAGDTDDPKAIDAAFADPLTIDLVLTEGGALADFLDAVGEVLPADERQLVATWLDVHRSVHELIETDPGAPVVVRDLRTGDLLTLTGTAFPQAARPGQLICAHVVPDVLRHEGDTGQEVGHQIVGGVFEVPDGAQQSLLEVLDSARTQRRGSPIAAWLAKLERSPNVP